MGGWLQVSRGPRPRRTGGWGASGTCPGVPKTEIEELEVRGAADRRVSHSVRLGASLPCPRFTGSVQVGGVGLRQWTRKGGTKGGREGGNQGGGKLGQQQGGSPVLLPPILPDSGPAPVP